MTHVYHIQLPQEYLPGTPLLFQSSDGKEHSICLPDTFSHKPGDIIYCALPTSPKNTQQLVRIDQSQLIKELKELKAHIKELKAHNLHNSQLIEELKAKNLHSSETKESKAHIEFLNSELFSMKAQLYKMQKRLSQMSHGAQAENDSGTLNTLAAPEIIGSDIVRHSADGVFEGPRLDAADGKTRKKRKKESHKRIRRTRKQIQDGIQISEIRNNTQQK